MDDKPLNRTTRQQTRTITLDDGQTLRIGSGTLRRLEAQGVDIGNLDNLSTEELRNLGISIRAETINIPGSRLLTGGVREIRLSDGALLEIAESTLRRLRNEGVDINAIPDMTPQELQDLGISIRTEEIVIPGAVQLDGGAQQITLKNGIIVVIDQATLKRLRSQGIDVNSIPNLTPADARRLGINIREDIITIPGAVQLDDGVQEFALSNGIIYSVTQTILQQLLDQGIDVNSLPTLSEADLRRLGITTRVTAVRIPGAVSLADGRQQIRLKNGVMIVIDQITLRRLRAQGVNLNTLPNLSQQELVDLGIQVTETISSVPRDQPIRIPGAIVLPDGSLQLRLRNGILLVIQQETLRRLQSEGVNLNTLPNKSQAELQELGIQVTETVSSTRPNNTPIRIPGAIVLPDGSLQLRLKNGVLLVIEQSTLRRLQSEGVDLNTLPNMSQAELEDLGIQVTETVSSTRPLDEPIRIPGAVTLPDGSLQIRLRNGIRLVIQQATLRRLQRQGVNLNRLPNMTQQQLQELGIEVTETVTSTQPLDTPIRIPGAVTLPDGSVQINLSNGVRIVISQTTLQRLQRQGVNLTRLPNMTQQELTALGIQVTETVTSTEPEVTPITIPGTITLPDGSLQIRLRNGVLVVIDQATLRRLRNEGVNLNTLPNKSRQELQDLGVQVTETISSTLPDVIPGTIQIPGAVSLPNGGVQIRIITGDIIVIQRSTLQRLQRQGVNLNRIPNMTTQELRRLGIQVTDAGSANDEPEDSVIRIPGAITVANGAQQIRLRNRVTIVVQQTTLQRLQRQGVNVSRLASMTPESLRRLGILVPGSAPSRPTPIPGPIRIPGAVSLPNGSVQIRLVNGVLVVIDQRTLRRLQTEGVDLNSLPTLSAQELSDLGIQVTETVTAIRIPGATVLPNGSLRIRLRNGVIVVIDQRTLQRLRNEGVNLNELPNKTREELQDLGVEITEVVTSDQPIRIPGTTTLPNGSIQVRLSNGVIVVIDQRTLQRLQNEGVNLNQIPNMTQQQLEDLGIQVTETVTAIRIPGATVLPNGSLRIRLRNGVIVVIDQRTLQRLRSEGVNLNTLPNKTQQELQELGVQITEVVTSDHPIRVPGATSLPNGSIQIRLSNGVIVVIDQRTLQRLQNEGVNLNQLPNMTQQELEDLGVQVTETVTAIRIPGATVLPNGSLRIRLRNGVLVVIDQRTLQRLRNEGVNLNTLPNKTQQELQALGVQITETVTSDEPIRIPGATVLPNGSLRIRLRNGVIVVIDQRTLQRLQSEGVNLNSLPSMTEQQLADLGVQITETVTSGQPIRIPGTTVLPNGSLQIRLRNGVIVVIDQRTLQRLRSEGVNLNRLPNMTQQELQDLGIQITETVTSDQPVRIPGTTVLPNGSLQIRLRNGVVIVIDQVTLQRLRSEGVNLNQLPNMSEQELSDLGIQITETVTGDRPIRIPGATVLPNGSLQIRLSNGVIVVIDQRTLQRLQREGVNLNRLPSMTQQQLADLGIQITETVTGGQPIRIPGATVLPNGSLQIRLANGIVVVIDQLTLQRLRNQGVNLNTLPNLSESELAALGIQVTETVVDGRPIRIPGAVVLPNGSLQIRLNNGVLIVIDQQTLRRLQRQGVNLTRLPTLSQAELIALGIQVTETVTGVNADQPLRPGVTRRIIVDGQVIVVPYVTLIRLQNQGIDIENLQSLGREELIRLRVIQLPVKTRPNYEDEGSAGNENEPAPEPFNFAYTSETADGSSSSHEATQTIDGVVTGSYTIKEPNGQERRVDYIADANGYRATVRTNELGTESKNTADAVYISSAPTAEELSRQFTASGGTSNFRTRLPDQQTITRRRLIDARPVESMIEKEESSGPTTGRLTAASTVAAETEDTESVPTSAETMTSGVQYTDEASEVDAVKIA